MSFVFIGAEAKISLDMALRGHYQGKLYHQQIDLVEALPPPVSEKTLARARWIALDRRGKCWF